MSNDAQQSLVESMKSDIQRLTVYLENVLPKGSVEKFIQMAYAARLRTPKLPNCNRTSLLLALIYCANRNLEPGVEDGCWLIPFKDKHGNQIVTPVPAYKGLIKRAKETGAILDLDAEEIRQGDEFEYHLGTDPHIVHRPPRPGTPRGEVVGYYVVIHFPDGRKKFKVMDNEEIDKIRDASSAWRVAPGTGPWSDWREEMAKKTVIKRAFKYIPTNANLRDLMADDSRIEGGESVFELVQRSGIQLPEYIEEMQERVELLPEAKKSDKKTKPPSGPDLTPEVEKFWNQVNSRVAAIQDDKGKSECQALVKTMVAATAKLQKTPTTPEQLMAKAAGNFAVFWQVFLDRWEQGKFFTPEPQASPPEPEPEPGPEPEDDWGEGGENEPPPGIYKEEEPEPGTPANRVVATFVEEQQAVWREMVLKGVRLPFEGVTSIAEIAPENIDGIKAALASFKSRGRKKA